MAAALVAIVLAVGTGVMLVITDGHSKSSSATDAQPTAQVPQTSPPAAASPTVPSTHADPSAGSGPLDNYLLAPAQVGQGALMFLADGGRSATNVATLDFCGFDYTSENLRAARVQVEYFGGSSHPASNEFVKYQPGGATKAFDELVQAVADCQAGWQSDGASYSLVQRAPADTALAPHQVLVSYRVSDDTGGLSLPWQAAVYQFNGDYFSGVYVYGMSRELALAQAHRLAEASARHLEEAAGGRPGTGGGPFQTLNSQGPDDGLQA